MLNGLLNNKKQFLLPIIAFMSGFCVMVVELTAARAVAPLIGSSVYTWTSIIGVILLGLSVGSYIGGYLIDRYKSIKILAGFIFLAAFFIGLIPFILKYVSYFVLVDASLVSKILIISTMLFFLPAVFLGCLSPTILKLYSEKIENIGKKSGIISSVWSLGSIVGTFLTGFYFTGVIGTSNSFFIISAILFLLSFLSFITSGKHLVKKYILFLPLLLATFLCFAEVKTENDKVVFSSESNYYKINVADYSLGGEEARFLFLDFDSHSIENKNSENMTIYTAVPPIFSFFKDNIEEIFVIGGGSYKIAKNFSDFYKNAEITVSEIDPEVTKVAEEFFGLSKYSIKTVIGDARINLETIDKKYDIIFGDAYNSFISVPWYMTTFEFNELTKSRLKEEGIYAVNFLSSIEGNNQFFESMLETFKKTFNNFYILAYGVNKKDPQNIILIGVNSNEEISHTELINSVKKIKNGENLWNKIVPQNSLEKNQSASILTDDFAPVEKLMTPLINDYFELYSKFFYSIF